MDSYWLSKASEAEAQLDQLRVEFEEMCRRYQQKIDKLEQLVLQSNLNAVTTEVRNEHIQ